MESYLSKESKKSLMDIINYIKNSEEYIKCNELKEKMKKDQQLLDLIEEVKKIQKKYIRSNHDQLIKKELDQKVEVLNNHKLYTLYNYYLEKVNIQIEIIKEELNDYFKQVTSFESK